MKIRPFELGRLVATPACIAAVPPDRIHQCLLRFLKGDWGQSCASDWHENDLATWNNTRIFAVYFIDEQNPDGEKFWIICESDRSSTCVLLPSCY